MGWEFSLTIPPHPTGGWAGCSEQSLLALLAPASPDHPCSSSFRQPACTVPQRWASSALTSQAHVTTAAITIISAGEWQETDFHWHSILYFFYSALFLRYWCFWSLSLRVSLAYRVTQRGTSHKVIQNTRRNHRSIKIRNKIFTCNFFVRPELWRQRTIYMAFSWDRYNSCLLCVP